MYLPDYLSVSFPLPPPGPDKGPVCFQVDEKWLPYLLAVVKALTTDGLYSTDADAAIGEAYNLLGAIEAGITCPTKPDLAGSEIDDCMGCCIRMRNGVLQVLQCGEWVTVDGWDPKAIASAPTVGVDGTPVPPAGKCQTYIGKVNAASKWALPATVNTGDVITVTNALGSWWTPLDLGIQRCPDGLIFIAGGCVDGTSHTEPGDPLNTAPHDCLIAFDGTHYYDCSAAADGGPATFTILSGVSTGTLIMMMNTPDTIGFGEVQFDIEICNNQATNWTHVFDFATAPGPLVIVPTSGHNFGHWVVGTGWVFDDISGLPQTIRGVEFNLPMASRNLTEIDLRLDYANGLNDANSAIPLQELDTNVGTVFSHLSGSGPTGSNITIHSAISQTAVTNIHSELICDDTNSAPTGNVVLRGMTVSGVGTDPF